MRMPLLMAVLAAAILCVGQAKKPAAPTTAPGWLKEDAPTARPPRPGPIRGTISPAAKVKDLWAVSRVTEKKYTPASFDRRTGRFEFAALPGDARYDLCLTTAEGRTIEGIDLDFDDARMLRLAELRRKELNIPAEREHPFTVQDVEALQDFCKKLKDFHDLHRILHIKAAGIQATVLVELLRTTEHYDGKGRYVWRVELWYFRHTYDGWEKMGNNERVLRRERISPADFARIDVEYVPALSVHVNETGESPTVKFTIPDTPDPNQGRVPGTAPDIPSKPGVIGLAAPEEEGQPGVEKSVKTK